jgi:predicted glutamine amidotransferase
MVVGAGSMRATEVAFLLQSVPLWEEVCPKMCRLLGYVSLQPQSFAQAVGEKLPEFVSLSSVHCDGWGVATFDHNSDESHLTRAPEIAQGSQTFKETISNTKTDGALLHLRWATSGIPVSENNTHPFISHGYSFIHNGAIYPANALDNSISQKFKTEIKGETDSERYFYFILSEIEKHGLVEGVVSAVREIKAVHDFSSINAMLMTESHFITVCEHDPERKPSWAVDGYYDLFYKFNDGDLVVASSGWDQSGWKNLPNHSVLVVERATLKQQVLAL